jgi:(S)-citramalyl-CoA lyase
MSSKLLITGGLESSFAPALASGATSVCLDLEDTVPEEMKAATRKLIPAFIGMKRLDNCQVAVRLSPLSTRQGLEDILTILELSTLPDSLVLTKVESAEEILVFDQLLSGTCAHLSFSVIIETPQALARVDSIAVASTRVTSLSFGGKDLSKASRMSRDWEPMLYARSRIVNAAAAAGIAVFDEPFHPRDDLDGLRQNCLRSKALGFTGKSTTDIRHPRIINEVFGRSAVG